MRGALPVNIATALKRVPRLSASEERDLLCRVQRGDRRAKERLVLSQLRFVIRIAGKYRRQYGCSLPDLVQEGTVGLLEAVKRFNPERGTRLSTFAMWWIRAAIQDYVLRSNAAVRIATTPRHRAMFFNRSLLHDDSPTSRSTRYPTSAARSPTCFRPTCPILNPPSPPNANGLRSFSGCAPQCPG